MTVMEKNAVPRRPPAWILILGALALASPLFAVGAQTWRQRDRSDFEKGEPRGVSLGADGTLRLSPRMDLLYEPTEPYVWTLAQDGKGALYAAGGNEGRIDRIAPDGSSRLFFRVEEPEVHALAIDGAGFLYAGTAPGGRVYKIAPDGSRAWTFETGEEYVWALALDRQGNVYAGTGVDGRIVRIDREGRGSIFFDTAETHVRALLIDAEGNLYAGTDGRGLVFRVSPRGEGFVLYDAPLSEVVALQRGPDGTMYAAIVGESGHPAHRREAPAPRPTPTPPPAPQEGMPLPAPSPAPGTPAEPRPMQEQRVPLSMEGKVLAISRDGYAREVWSGSQEAILSLALSAANHLLLGSSLQGRIYELDGDVEGGLSEIARAPSSQVTALLRRTDGSVAVAGSNFGTVSLLRPFHAASGLFESRVLDAVAFSRWGRIAWRADLPKGTAVTLSARSGNTEEPDRTWSEWGPSLDDPRGVVIDRPPARFLQWRARLTSDVPARTPVLREVAVTYLQANLPPEIHKVEVQPAGVAFQKVPVGSGAPSQEARPAGSAAPDVSGTARRRGSPQSRRGFEPGARSVTWQAADPNDDDLEYDVYYRAVDETQWKRVRTRVDEDFATLDSTAMPDGTYLFRIVASDAPSNAPGEALTTEALSSLFDVDNTPPRVEEIRAKPETAGLRLTFTVRDTFSIIGETAYAVDAGDWIPIAPTDRINDALVETYDVVIPRPGRGEHSIVVRAADAAGNVGAGKVIVDIP
jgi:PQQ-like domain